MELFERVKQQLLNNKKLREEGKFTGVPTPFKRMADYIPLICERGHSVGVLGNTGCLSKDTIIRTYRCSRHACREYTIEKLYEMQKKYRKSKHNINETRVLSYKYDIQGTGRHLINQIVYSGIKDVFEVTTETGKKIKSTKDHRYLISTDRLIEDDNFKKLENLKEGDEIFIKSPKVTFGRKKRVRGKELFGKFLYYKTAKNKNVNGYTYQRVYEYRAIYDAHLNNLSLEKFLEIVSTDANHNLIFSDTNKDIHHIDGNRNNNDINNLQLLTKEEHNKHHADYTRLGYHKIHKEKIVSIKYIGKEETYDIICEDPYHNFIANDFVVHNSGKSRYSRFMYLYTPFKFYKETGYPIHILMFGLEDSKEKIMRNLICHYLYELYDIRINLFELGSTGNRILPDFVVEKLEEAKEFFNDFDKVVTIVDGHNEPTQIYDFCKEYALRTGKVDKYDIDVKGKKVTQYKYTPNNDVHTIVIIDNLANIEQEEGQPDERRSTVYFCRNLVRGKLCNIFNFTVIQIMQQDFASERQSFTKDGTSIVAKLEPSLASIGDAKTVARSMHEIYGIFHPVRFGLIHYPIPTKTNPHTYRLDILGNRFRSIHVLKANDTDFGQKIAINFDAVTETMTELPELGSEELNILYKNIENKQPQKFSKVNSYEPIIVDEEQEEDELPF